MPSPAFARAVVLHRRAVDEHNAGRPARALRTLRAAWHLVEPAGDEEAVLAARIWISMAMCEGELHGVDAALTCLTEASRWVSQAADPSLEALVCVQRGLIELRHRSLDEALRHFTQAVEAIDHLEPRDACMLLVNRGTLALYLPDLSLAAADFRRAARYAEQISDRLRLYMSRHNLAYVDFIRGDLPLALDGMQHAAEFGNDLPQGIPLLDRARVLVEAGLAHEADRVLAEAATIFRRDRLAQDLAETELERARCALVAGDHAAARRFASSARDRFRRRGNDRWRRRAELVLLQGDLAGGRPGPRLVGPAQRLADEFGSESADAQARTARLIAAEAYLSGGESDAARAIIDTLGRPGRREPITARLHDTYVRAHLDAVQGDRGTAVRNVRAGLDTLGAYQARFGSIDLQTAAAIHGRRLAELGIELALRTGRPAAILTAAEQARAMSSRLPAVRPPQDSAAAELLADLRFTVESLRTAGGAEAEALQRRRADLERQINARRWTLSGGGSARRPATAPRLRSRLASTGSVMVTYLEARGRLVAVTLGDKASRLYDLGDSGAAVERVRRVRADLDVLAQPLLPGGIASAVRASCERSLAALDETLVRPWCPDGRRLVVVTTGILGHLPWGALPSLRGVPVVVAPSATGWLSSCERPCSTDPSVVAVAGPHLERADEEVKGVCAAWPTARAVSGPGADRSSVTAALAASSVVHIAAHGVHQTENPLFSSLRLADGPMFAHELDQTARTPEHVILSACELGLATVRPGDEALGLTSVLLHLGTRSVVAGVARVGDDVAAETMIAYHRGLAAGRDSAEALAEALAGLDAEQPAPFVCFGSAWGI